MTDPVILNNRYIVEEQLGSGGMAMVYRARDLRLDRNVAIKLLRKDYSGDSEFRDRFQDEAKTAAQLTHPNIVTVYDFGLHEDRLFIVMEYVPGTDLKAILRNNGRLDVDEALPLMVQACAGIGYAHRSGLVHCDLKPQNLLVTPDQHTKVVDFGIARALVSISPDEKAEVVWGSPKYFSPEQAAGSPPSPASDVYSLGVVLYEVLTGQVPFHADSAEELARQHREVPPPSPRRLNPLISPQMDAFLLQVLAKDPSHRYRNADQMGQILLSFISPNENGIELLPTLAVGLASPSDVHTEQNSGIHTDQGVTTTKPSVERRSQGSSNTSPKTATVGAVRNFDLITWILGLLTLVAVGGLIPFWLWVYYIVYPPVK